MVGAARGFGKDRLIVGAQGLTHRTNGKPQKLSAHGKKSLKQWWTHTGTLFSVWVHAIKQISICRGRPGSCGYPWAIFHPPSVGAGRLAQAPYLRHHTLGIGVQDRVQVLDPCPAPISLPGVRGYITDHLTPYPYHHHGLR